MLEYARVEPYRFDRFVRRFRPITSAELSNSGVEEEEADFMTPFYAVLFSRVPAVVLGGMHRCNRD